MTFVRWKIGKESNKMPNLKIRKVGMRVAAVNLRWSQIPSWMLGAQIYRHLQDPEVCVGPVNTSFGCEKYCT